MREIGRMEEVDVRNLWRHEQYDFSTWLAKDENIKYLNDILELTLTEVHKETPIGPYRCDIVAKDETTNDTIIIENQLETTNHDHLGKIITYAAGLNAKYIVWIVRKADEEHRAAIEWLNNNSSDNANFFLIEIHAYQIENSKPAPMFEVIEKPNNYVKDNKASTKDSGLSKSQSERLAFWQQFNQAVVDRGAPFNTRKATKDHWYDVAIGTSDAHIAIDLVNKERKVVVELYINNDKELFDELFENKEEIEDKFGHKLEWNRLNNRKASRIKFSIKGLNFDDHSNYNSLNEQIIDAVVGMKMAFGRYI